MEFYQFCNENRTFRNRDVVVNNCCLILAKPEDLENSRKQVAKCPYETIPGTQKLHQIENRHSMSSGKYAKNYLCTCLPCRISTDTFRTSPETVCLHCITYRQKKGDEESDSDSDAFLDDNDVANSDGVISNLLQVGDIAVIWAGDPVFFFYVMKVTQQETILEKFITDDYGHTYPPGTRVVEGNYLQISSEDPDQATYYLKKKKSCNNFQFYCWYLS